MSIYVITKSLLRYLSFGKKDVLYKRIVFTIIFSSLIFTSGCHKVTEFDTAFAGGLYVISSQDFSITNYVSGISGGRSLLVYPGNIFIASTEGVVSRYDSESTTLIEEFVVGSPSPSGFTQMALNASGNSAYLIGSLGQIVELSLPECTIKDVFTVCQSPVAIAVAPGNPSYLYVGDGPTKSINQVSIPDNNLLTSVTSYYNIKCIEPGWNADTILVGTSDRIYMVLEYGPGAISLVGNGFGSHNADAIAAVPYDSTFVVATESQVGLLEFLPDAVPGHPATGFEYVDLEGSNHSMSLGHDSQHAYVLSYMGDFTCRLTSYNYVFNRIDQQVDFPGFPLDIKASSSGKIYVLTYE